MDDNNISLTLSPENETAVAAPDFGLTLNPVQSPSLETQTLQQQEEAEKGKKRNMWLMIGAAILGVLGFGGNQVAQHMRSTKNQKSMMEMQQNAIKRAENPAPEQPAPSGTPENDGTVKTAEDFNEALLQFGSYLF